MRVREGRDRMLQLLDLALDGVDTFVIEAIVERYPHADVSHLDVFTFGMAAGEQRVRTQEIDRLARENRAERRARKRQKR